MHYILLQNWIYLSLSALLLLSCSSSTRNPVEKVGEELEKNEELAKIKIPFELDSASIHLSNFGSNFRLVRLESSFDALIGESQHITRFGISDKYIIVLGGEKVLQFSINGEYIRTLTVRGKGPKEFLAIKSYAIDRELDLFYYSKSNQFNQLVLIDLNTGQFLPPLNLPIDSLGSKENGIYIDNISILQDHSLLCTIPPYLKSNYDVFGMTSSGEFTGGFKRNQEQGSLSSFAYLTSNKREIFYKHPFGDTLFLINNWKKKPIALFSISSLHESLDMIKYRTTGFVDGKPTFEPTKADGTIWSIFHYSDNENYSSIQVTAGREGGDVWQGFTPYKRRLLFIQNGKPFIFKETIIDVLNLYFSENYTPLFYGEHIIFPIHAYELKEKLKELKESSQLNGEVLNSRIVELDSLISEEDNAILIIGKNKSSN